MRPKLVLRPFLRVRVALPLPLDALAIGLVTSRLSEGGSDQLRSVATMTTDNVSIHDEMNNLKTMEETLRLIRTRADESRDSCGGCTLSPGLGSGTL